MSVPPPCYRRGPSCGVFNRFSDADIDGRARRIDRGRSCSSGFHTGDHQNRSSAGCSFGIRPVGSQDIACATCHHPDFACTDGRGLPLGTGSVGLGPGCERNRNNTIPVVPRNAHSIINTAFNGLDDRGGRRGRRGRDDFGVNPVYSRRSIRRGPPCSGTSGRPAWRRRHFYRSAFARKCGATRTRSCRCRFRGGPPTGHPRVRQTVSGGVRSRYDHRCEAGRRGHCGVRAHAARPEQPVRSVPRGRSETFPYSSTETPYAVSPRTYSPLWLVALGLHLRLCGVEEHALLLRVAHEVPVHTTQERDRRGLRVPGTRWSEHLEQLPSVLFSREPPVLNREAFFKAGSGSRGFEQREGT